jgi:hypothetical protein
MKYLRPIKLIGLLVFLGLVLAVVSGVWSSPGDSNIDKGYDLRRAADILFVILVIIIFLLTSALMSGSHSREQRFDLVLLQVFIVSPILFLRSIYAAVQAFISTPQNPGHNTWVYLGLLLIPDAISLTIFTICGFILPRESPSVRQWRAGNGQANEAGLDPTSPPQLPTIDEHSRQKIASQDVSEPQSTYAPPRRGGRRRRGGPIMMLIQALSNDE